MIELHWREVYGDDVSGARFALQYPADWSVYQVEFCDGIIPVMVGFRPGGLFELDFGYCRTTDPVKVGRIVFNVRSRGVLYLENQEARRCPAGWEPTLSHGQIELGLSCEIAALPACGFCGPYQVFVDPRRFERVFVVGTSGSDTFTAVRQTSCINPGDCTGGVTDCYGFARSEAEWATLTDLGGSPQQHTYLVDYLVQGFPAGRYQGGISNQDDVCNCRGDCVALDIQVIEEMGGNRQPIARIRPFGAETNPVPFDGRGSFDLDGSPLAYFWDFGDGGTSTDPVTTHVFALGSATVTLVVSDGVLSSTPDSLSFDVIPAGTVAVGDPDPAAPGSPGNFMLEVLNPVAPGRDALRFALPAAARVRLELFDAAGRRWGTLVAGARPAGTYSVTYAEVVGLNTGPRSGIFFVRLADGDGHVAVRKLLLLK